MSRHNLQGKTHETPSTCLIRNAIYIIDFPREARFHQERKKDNNSRNFLAENELLHLQSVAGQLAAGS
jgi:hypothetical protein